MSDLVLPLESAEFIIKNAKSVEVCQEGVVHLSKKVTNNIKNMHLNENIKDNLLLLKDL
jgi:hypothetical protein